MFSNFVPAKNHKNVLVMNKAENMLSNIPMLKVKAKPLIKLVPNQKRIKATIKVVIFPSLIEGQLLLNPSIKETLKLFSCFISSLILEKIKTLASTAMPIERIKPPMPAKVKVTEINLNMLRISNIYIIKDNEAKTHVNR